MQTDRLWPLTDCTKTPSPLDKASSMNLKDCASTSSFASKII